MLFLEFQGLQHPIGAGVVVGIQERSSDLARSFRKKKKKEEKEEKETASFIFLYSVPTSNWKKRISRWKSPPKALGLLNSSWKNWKSRWKSVSSDSSIVISRWKSK